MRVLLFTVAMAMVCAMVCAKALRKKDDSRLAFCAIVVYQAEIHIEVTGIYYGMTFMCGGKDRYAIVGANPQYYTSYVTDGWYIDPQSCTQSGALVRGREDTEYPQDVTAWQEKSALFWSSSDIQVDCQVNPCQWVMLVNANANQAFRNGYYELLDESLWCFGRPAYSHLTSDDFLFYVYENGGFVGWIVGPTRCINYGGIADSTDVVYPQNAGGPWQQYTNGEWIFNYQLAVFCTNEPTTPGPSTLPPQCQLNDALKNRCASDDISQDDCINIEGCCWDDSVQTTTVTGTAAPTPSCYEPVLYTTPDVLNDICTLPTCSNDQTLCWPNNNNCTTYWTCRSSVWQLNWCPEGSYVNPYSSDCSTPCIQGDTSGCQILQQCITTPAPTPPSTMDPCYIPPGACELGTCTVNPYDCQGYLKCQGSFQGAKWVPQVCGSPQNYVNLRATSCAMICANFDSNVCNITSNCVTPNSPTYTTAMTAPPYCALTGYCLSGQCRPKLDDCEAYWYCTDLNNEIYQECDNGTYVNAKAGGDCAAICTGTDLQSCQDDLALCGSTQAPTVSTTMAGHAACHSMTTCVPGAYYVDRSDCHYYLICIVEAEEDPVYYLQETKCPSDYVFDPMDSSCKSPSAVNQNYNCDSPCTNPPLRHADGGIEPQEHIPAAHLPAAPEHSPHVDSKPDAAPKSHHPQKRSIDEVKEAKKTDDNNGKMASVQLKDLIEKRAKNKGKLL